MSVRAAIRVPQITQEELCAFHESHFSPFSIADFATNFTTPPGLADEPDGDDGEGLAADGLPDDNDAVTDVALAAAANGDDDYEPAAVHEELLHEDAEQREETKSRKRRRRRKNNNGSGGSGSRWRVEKPDLRKRTWDVVETGLGSLDYGGVDNDASPAPAAASRRRVRYDDAE